MDDSVKALLRAAGHDPDSLKPDEVKFVYSFLENYNESSPLPPKPPSPSYISAPAPITHNKPMPPPPPSSYSRNQNPSTSDAKHRALPQVILPNKK